MKKLTFVIVAAISLAASAAWQKAGSIQVADAQAFTKAVMKLGEISGNQMLGALAAGFLAEPPGSKFFGPMRPNSTALLPVFFDDSALDKGFDKLGDAVKAADELTALSHEVRIPETVKLMKEIVPEYISNNSRFEEFDKK